VELKSKIRQHYLQQIQDKEDAFRDMILALTEDSKNDAKGSAGDKHETALAMMHIEQEKLNQKLLEILDQKAIITKIDSNLSSSKIALGSLVQANGMLFYVSAALPKITVDGKTIMALSQFSPLGKELIGREAGHTFEVNASKFTIEQVF
jgi:hypothetical protein